MHHPSETTASPAPGARALIVADWTVDARAVASAARSRAAAGAEEVDVLVPAWLHGLDWAGDPRASVPCAQLQLEAICDLATAAGLPVETAAVGDPDPMTAIGDAVHDWPADEVLLFARPPRFLSLGPLDLRHRAQRLIGRPVRQVPVPRSRSTTIAMPCAATSPQPAASRTVIAQ